MSESKAVQPHVHQHLRIYRMGYNAKAICQTSDNLPIT